MPRQNYCSNEEAKSLICDIGKKMYAKDFVAANDGNITIRVGSDEVWVTPNGVSKSLLEPGNLLKVSLRGDLLEGEGIPTSELPMHLRIYHENDAVVSTCHSHSPWALAFACSGIEPDRALAPEPMVLVGPVKIAPFAYPGTNELADSIAPFCKDYNVVLLANHGSLAWGRTPLEAWYRMEALEAYCRLNAMLAFFPVEPRYLGEDQIEHIMTKPEYDVSTLGRHHGVPHSSNTGAGAPLSGIGLTGSSWILAVFESESFLDGLAERIAMRINRQKGAR
jgi:L-fuculose-phosphate aldolase